jgi:preprotein translocase subunit SecD
MAMVVDGVTISVYSVTAPQNVGSVLISGHFTETEGGARSLVALINAGAG